MGLSDTDSTLAKTYRSMAPEKFAGLDNDVVLKVAQKLDPQFKNRINYVNEQINKDGQAQWAKQNPVENIVEVAAKPLQWFQQQMGELAQSTQAAYETNVAKDIKNIVANSGLGKIMAGSGAVNDIAEQYKTQKDKEMVSGKLDEDQMNTANENRQFVDFLQGNNPVPKNVGEAVVGGAQVVGMEGLGALAGLAKKATAPSAVEGALRKVGGGGPFDEVAKQAETVRVNDVALNQTRKWLKETAIKLKEQQTSADKASAKLAAVNSLMPESDHSFIPQEDQVLLGRDISAALTNESSPNANAAHSRAQIAQEPINAVRSELTNKEGTGALDAIPVPMKAVRGKLRAIVDSIPGLIDSTGDAAVKRVLGKYVDLDVASNVRPSVLNKLILEDKLHLNDLSAGAVHADAATLGELARKRVESDPVAAMHLKEAQQVLRDAITKSVPEKLGQAVIENRRQYAEWYKQYDNDFIKAIRDKNPSGMYDPIFGSPEMTQAFKNAVDPAIWERVKANKINEYTDRIFNSENPKATLSAIKAKIPGHLESFLIKDELATLADMASNKEALNIVSQDLNALNKEYQKNLEATKQELRDYRDRNRREGDPGYRPRRGEELSSNKASQVTKQNLLATASGLGVFGALLHFEPTIAGAAATLAAAKYAPSVIAKLYLAAPEVRSMILDVGRAANHIDAVKSTAKLSAFLDAKTREVKSYEASDKEGKKKPMPPDLKVYQGIR